MEKHTQLMECIIFPLYFHKQYIRIEKETQIQTIYEVFLCENGDITNTVFKGYRVDYS